jgi:hypothetical protein
VAEADEKYTAPRIKDLARRVVRGNNPDDYAELLAAQASLMDARDGDMRRLEARLRDSSTVLTHEERKFLADFHSGKALPRPAHKPLKPSVIANWHLAGEFQNAALEAKAHGESDWSIEKLIAETYARFGLCKTDAWEVYRLVKASRE